MKEKSYSTISLLKRFIAFVRPYKVFVFAFLFVSFLNIFVSISEGYLVKSIVNAALDKNIESIRFYIYAMLGIILLGSAISYLLQYLFGVFSSNAMKDFRLHLFRHFQKLPPSLYETRHSGDLLSRFTNDASAVQNFFGRDILGLFLDVILFISVFIYMAAINWKLLLFSIMLSPPAVIAVNFMANYVKKYSRMNREFTGKSNNVIQDAVNGIFMVKSFNLRGAP